MPAKKGNKYAQGNKGGGNKTRYKAENANIAKTMCLLGATDKHLADCFEVSEQTINNWKGKHKEFYLALKEGKMYSDAMVAKALYNRALGQTIKEVKTNDDGSVSETIKEIPPDPTSMIFWLKNRQPELWRDKQSLEHTGKDGGPILTKHEREERLKELLGKKLGTN